MSVAFTTEYAKGWDDHVAAVKPQLEQLAELEIWKREQMEVESTWSAQDVGEELGLTLGDSIRPQILPKIRELKRQLAAAQAAMVKYREWWNETKVEYPTFFRNFAPPELPDGTSELDTAIAEATSELGISAAKVAKENIELRTALESLRKGATLGQRAIIDEALKCQ